MAVSAAKADTLKFFELYGLARTAGKVPREVLTILAEPGDEALTEVLDALGSTGAVALATVQGNLAMAVGIAEAIGSFVGAGDVVGAIAEAFAWVVGEMAKGATVTCATGCGDEDRDRRGFIGLWPPPAFTGAIGMTAEPLVGHWHDGLIKQARVTADNPTGPADGAFCRIQDGAPDPVNRSERLYRSSGITGSVTKGTWARPWELASNKYYRRAWQVTSLLQWVQDNVQCSHILCMAAHMGGLPRLIVAAKKGAHGTRAYGEALSAALTEQRRKAGRWAASVYWLQKDVASTVREIGRDRAVQIFRELGDARTASAVETWLPRDGMSSTELAAHWRATYQPQQLEFNWTPLVRHLSLENAKAFLDRALPRPVQVQTIATPRFTISQAQLDAARNRQNAPATGGGKAAVAVGAAGLLAVGLFLALR